MTTGIIFNIQRYSIHDGPGIRTTVFLKGCPLSCWWCQNPESQLSGQEMIFWGDRCISCGACSAICPSSAIQIKNGIPITEKEKCILCGKCIEKCPALAREMIGKKMTVEKVAPKVNLFLYDLKIMDSERHRKYTGVSNEIILENLKKLSSAYHNISVRFPVIPGINDDDQNIRETGEFLSSLKITQVNLLPYHYIGIDKYKRLGRTYKLVITQPPSEEKLSEISGILSKFNLKV